MITGDLVLELVGDDGLGSLVRIVHSLILKDNLVTLRLGLP
jgi:hypothetical protein